MLIGIWGTGRNGSSLIGHLLDGLQGTYVHPVEEKFVSAFDSLARHGRVTRHVEQNCTVRKLVKKMAVVEAGLLRSYYRTSFDELLRHSWQCAQGAVKLEPSELFDVIAGEAWSVEAFLPDYLSAVARKVRPDLRFEHFLFKSIETPYIADYEALFPEMRHIHIIRDPVAVCSSQKRSILENKKLPASYLGYDWLSCMLDGRWLPHARFLAERVNDPRHIVIRYEDLVVSPVGLIRGVSEKLGLAPPPRPEVQTIFHNLDRKNWGGNPSKKGVATPTRVEADLQSKNNYDEVLTEREIDLISLKTRVYLPLFNYASTSSATKLNVALKYLRVDKWELLNICRGAYLLRALTGLVYRRLRIFW